MSKVEIKATRKTERKLIFIFKKLQDDEYISEVLPRV